MDNWHLHQTVTQQTPNEINIFFAPDHQFGNGQVMNFETKTRASTSVLVADWHEPFTPASWQNRCFLADSVRIITEGLMKRRAFANRTVNQVAVSRVAQREDIRLDGDKQFIRSLGKLSQHGLTADDDKFRRAGDAGGRPDDMFKLLPVHDGSGI